MNNNNNNNRDGYMCCGNCEKLKLQPQANPDTQVSPISLPPSVNIKSQKLTTQKEKWCIIL